jgi:hypothetical protein
VFRCKILDLRYFSRQLPLILLKVETARRGPGVDVALWIAIFGITCYRNTWAKDRSAVFMFCAGLIGSPGTQV